MRLTKAVTFLSILLLVLPALAAERAENFCPRKDSPDRPPQIKSTQSATTALEANSYWDGMLRVYVVEKVSSMDWESGGEPYHFPFLAFALNSIQISMIDAYWDTTVTWDGHDFDYDNLQEDNIAVQAVLFTQSSGLAEAAAMAEPGVPGSNLSDGNYTHTVFAEEGTATW